MKKRNGDLVVHAPYILQNKYTTGEMFPFFPPAQVNPSSPSLQYLQSFAGLLVGCLLWDQGVSQEKTFLHSVCFSDQGSSGGRARGQVGTRTGRKEALWLPDWQEVKVSISVFKPEPITLLRCGRQLFLLSPQSLLHQTIKLSRV